MTYRLRQVLTLLLLFLFSLENMAAAILVSVNNTNLSQSDQYVQQEIQTLCPLLAEENEERANKDGTAFDYSLAEAINSSPKHLLALAAGMKRSSTNVRLTGKSIPRYTIFCSFII